MGVLSRKSLWMSPLDQLFDSFVLVEQRPQVEGQVYLDQGHIIPVSPFCDFDKIRNEKNILNILETGLMANLSEFLNPLA